MIALGVGFSSRCEARDLVELATGVWQALPADARRDGGRIATLAHKRDSGLLEAAARQMGLEPVYLEPPDLAPFQPGRTPSAAAEAAVGLASVAEAAALAAAGPDATLLTGRTTSGGATCAAARGGHDTAFNHREEP
ncbi:cobalt-precorrin 5A hydrolase [Thiohalospira halophila DSM 15071]|uniref:Cobalt-precorrin 5A hydrolase n=1 Tax=Thiohalospira halophila DSM 15071 TaxID=1123397 RepID=A0A1I1Q4M3_9GAMM|nr:cobalamin biosynthesis protein [Thiohalospira halophila]SFD16912.1 cobalt-precorrin 5A hydrolase [Thiohalospira halophila DSM 15071]